MLFGKTFLVFTMNLVQFLVRYLPEINTRLKLVQPNISAKIFSMLQLRESDVILDIWNLQTRDLKFNLFTLINGTNRMERRIEYPIYEIKEPKFINNADKRLFYKQYHNRKTVGFPSLDTLKGQVFIFPNGAIKKSIDCGYKSSYSDFVMSAGDVPSVYEGVVIPLLVPDSFSFQHFIDGVLPKILQVLDIILLTNAKILIFKPRDYIIYEILYKIGISLDKILVPPNRDLYDYGPFYTTLMINTCVAPPMHPILWQTAKTLIVGKDKIINKKNSLIVLISRSRSTNRGRILLNEEKISKVLHRRYGDQLNVYSRKQSLNETIEIFSRARVLIGMHGGGLYNLNFAPRMAHIVELLPTDVNGQPCPPGISHRGIWLMAQHLGQNYWRLPVTPLGKHGNAVLSVRRLTTVLDKIDKETK